MTTKILIVEDEPDIVLSLVEDMRRQGYETEVATDGEKALREMTPADRRVMNNGAASAQAHQHHEMVVVPVQQGREANPVQMVELDAQGAG